MTSCFGLIVVVVIGDADGKLGSFLSGEIAFEVVSAFGTVGLSLDFTATMTLPGKLVIIVTMFAGRVGLLAFVFLGDSVNTENFVYPEAEILIG